MTMEIFISGLTFSDGTSVSLGRGSALVIVGPNNVGKSHALRDIQERLSAGPFQPPPTTIVVTGVTVTTNGTSGDLVQWLDRHAYHRPPVPGQERVFNWPGGGASEKRVAECWDGDQPMQFGELSSAFFAFADGASRLGLAHSVAAPDLATEAPNSPLAALYEDAAREQELADATREAFGVPVVINRVAGGQIHLHVGQLPEDLGQPIPTLPRIETQGDGFRSYVGLMLMMVASEFATVIIDEPEAFLHPPQERALGSRLSKEVEKSKSQLVLATHSLDILLGALTAEDASVTVLRLRREGAANRAAVLEPEAVRALWNDPIIRYSNALDGIFHRGLIVCEGDADARFYDATLQAARQRQGSAEHGLLFVHCGGKQRAPVIAEALRDLDVPVRIICDMDVLRQEEPLRRIVEALGGQWDTVSVDWALVRTGVDQRSAARRRLADVERDVHEVFEGSNDDYLTKETARALKHSVRYEDTWTTVKEVGQSAIPNGDATQAWRRLDQALRSAGLFVVPVGALEGWDAGEGNHGPRWTVSVLQAGLHRAEGPHAEFVETIDQSVP
jgi:hypothetical protein